MLTARNLLTGEETENRIFTGAFPGQTQETVFAYTSPRCGVMQLQAKNVRLYDWLGVFSVKAACEAYARTAVLPDTFPVELIADPESAGRAEGDGELQNASGDDLTDINGLRGYAPGEPLRAIHWKLSAKTDELLIRVGSLPKEDEILLLWERSGPEADPAVRDALAECVASVGQALLAGGVKFTLGRLEGDACFVGAADGEEAFLSELGVLLGAPDRSESFPPRELEESGRFSAARNAYNALTDAQKALVTKLGTLTSAEAALSALQAAAQEETPAQEEQQSKKSFWQSILDFFRTIINFFKRLFGVK